jgi:predicted type IV restriction endonuclease
MELVDKVKALGGRIEKQRQSVLTEEAAKTAFVMPFLNALGYDVFNPEIVVPEFIATPFILQFRVIHPWV